MDNNNKDSKQGELTELDKLKNTNSNKEFQREFMKLLEKHKKSTDDWFRVVMFGERQEKKD